MSNYKCSGTLLKAVVKTAAVGATSCLFLFLCSGCGKHHPGQGPGTLWIYEGDQVRKVEVRGVTFWTSRTTTYVGSDGLRYQVQAPVYYKPLQ